MFKLLPGFWEHEDSGEDDTRLARRLLFAGLSLGSVAIVAKVIARFLAR
jgi:hypothetical protein